jgi:hypothetical protein
MTRGLRVLRTFVPNDPIDGSTRGSATLRNFHFGNGFGSNGTFGLRMFLHVEELPDADAAPMIVFVEGEPAGTISLHASSKATTLRIVRNGVPTEKTADAFVPGRWQCIELLLSLTIVGSARLFVGGASQPLIEHTNIDLRNHFFPGIQVVRIGVVDPPRVGASAIHIDDIAYGEGRMGCE